MRRKRGATPSDKRPEKKATVRLFGFDVPAPRWNAESTKTYSPMSLIPYDGTKTLSEISPESRELLGLTPLPDFESAMSTSVVGTMPVDAFEDIVVSEAEKQEEDLSASVVHVLSPDSAKLEGFAVVRPGDVDMKESPVPRFSADGEVPDEPGEVYSIVQRSTGMPAELMKEGVWVLSNYENECRLFAFSGKPLNPELEGVLVEQVDLGDNVVYKAFSADGSRILGQGGFGIAILVTDRTNPNPETWVPVVIKIEVKRIANPDQEREARGDVFKEVLIGMLLDRVFYRGRVTPSVTRTLAVFQCPHLPPPIGAWKSLTDAIWPHGISDVRSQVAADPSKQYLYTEQEFANAGTINGLVSSRPTPALEAMSNPADHKMFVRSLTFQALYTLEAFRRAGFIHADINMNNVALEEIPVGEGHRRVYFVNRLGGPHETILAFDPFGQTTHNRFRLKFIDYGNSMFAYRDPRRMKYREGMRLIATPGQRIVHALTPIYNSPPEAVMRDAIVFDETGKAGVDTHWWASTAADLWQVCMILVTLVFGEHPLFGSILQSPPNKFRDRVMFHIKSHPESYDMLEYNNMTQDIPSHLWNIAVLIGVPGTDFRSGLIDPKQRDLLEGRYPLLANFRLAGAKQTGWLRASKKFKEFFGVGLGLMILRSLGWDPTLRPVPGEILDDPKVLGTFRAFQYVPFGGNPRDVSMKLHNRVMYKEEMEAWSLLASDISYHVPISKPLKGRGPSRFTRLPKELAEFFEEEGEEIPPLGKREEEARESSWSRWMF